MEEGVLQVGRENFRFDLLSWEVRHLFGFLQIFACRLLNQRYDNDKVLTKVIDCLAIESARDEVKNFILDEILIPLVEQSTSQDLVVMLH
jgi:hypothetical protein